MLYLQRGVLLAMKARMSEAEKEFETARRLAPEQAVPYAALGMAWMQSGQTDKAVEVLRAERTRSKDHIVPYIFSVALLRSGVDPASPAATEAVEALRASIQAKPDFAPARAELGRLLFKRDEVDPAIAELEKAPALDPGGHAGALRPVPGLPQEGRARQGPGPAGPGQQAERAERGRRSGRRAPARGLPHRQGRQRPSHERPFAP